VSGSSSYPLREAIPVKVGVLVGDQYQPLNPLRAAVVGDDPERPNLVKVMPRESRTGVWIDRRRIAAVGRTRRSRRGRGGRR